MSSGFCYKVYLPSTDTYEYFKELTNKELLTILKYCANSDKHGLSIFLESLILKKSVNQLTLHRVDKFCILYTMMLVCIKNTVTLVCKCEETDKEYNTVINIIDILNVISNMEYTGDVETIRDGQNVYEIRFPRDVYNSKLQLSVADVIHSIEIDGSVYNTQTYTPEQINIIVNKLPGGVVTRILNSIKLYNSKYNNIYMSYKSPYAESSAPIEHSVSLLNNELFETYYLMVNSDLKSFYEMSHSMAVNFSLSHTHYLNMTPAETVIYYDLMKNDIETRAVQEKGEQNNIENATSV